MKKMYKHVKYLLALVLVCILSATSMGQAIKPIHADDTLTGLTSQEIVARMGFGWNLGNTFDATGGNKADPYSGETSWGNPRVTKELIQTVHAAGFDTIRIPVTWNNYLEKDGTYKISQGYLDRVKEVVGYAIDEGMFVILNVHHESWVNDKNLEKNYEKIGEQLAAVWYQIAENFADFDQHLIFEGMNEPRKAGSDVEWGGNQASYAAVNYLIQIFVNAVRLSDKGYNSERCLMIPGYAASNSYNILNSITLPTFQGETVKNLIVSVHSYSPYNFCLSDSMRDFDPNKSECVSEINSMFVNLNDLFLSNGIPVIIGETSATAKDNTEARERWASYMATKAASYGVPIVIWDNGSDSKSGGESHAYINRRTNEWNYPTVIKALMDAKASVTWGSAVTKKSESGSTEPADTMLGGTVIWENTAGLTSKKEWDNSYIQFAAKEDFFKKGGEIGVVTSGSGDVKIILDSEQKSAWWIPVDPSRTETVNGKKVTYFSYDAMISAMKSNGVNAPGELRNFCIISTNTDVTTYEIEVIGGVSETKYVVFGATYASGNELPEEPTYTNLKFLGWYGTKDYQEESRYEGGIKDGLTTVYAKFGLDMDLKSQLVMKGLVEGEVPPTEEAPSEAITEETPSDSITEEEAGTIIASTEKETAIQETTGPSKNEETEALQKDDRESGNMTLIIILAVVAVLIAIAGGVTAVVMAKKRK